VLLPEDLHGRRIRIRIRGKREDAIEKRGENTNLSLPPSRPHTHPFCLIVVFLLSLVSHFGTAILMLLKGSIVTAIVVHGHDGCKVR
jgi:hypothetical protein